MQRIGTRNQVMKGLAKQTGGGLKKKDLKYNKRGKIVSKKLSALAIQRYKVQRGGNKELLKALIRNDIISECVAPNECLLKYDEINYSIRNEEVKQNISKCPTPYIHVLYFKNELPEYKHIYYTCRGHLYPNEVKFYIPSLLEKEIIFERIPQ